MEVRIVSLSDWGTQLLLDLDLDHWIAGRSHDSLILAEGNRDVPVVTIPVTSGDVHALSQDKKLTLTEILLSPWNVDMDLLKVVKPSHIITEGMLHLSGLTKEEAEQILEQDGLTGCHLIDIYPMSLEDIFDGILNIAKIFGYEERGEKLAGDCRKGLKKIIKKYGIKRSPPVVAVIHKWPSLQLIGRWISDMIEMIGAIPIIYGDDLYVYPETYFEKSPDIFIAGQQTATLQENEAKIQTLDKKKLSSLFSCDTTATLFAVDGPIFYNRSCTGLHTALKILGEILKKDPKLKERKGVYWNPGFHLSSNV